MGNSLPDPLSLQEWPGIYYDASGDDMISARDALIVINDLAELQLTRLRGEGEHVTFVGSMLRDNSTAASLQSNGSVLDPVLSSFEFFEDAYSMEVAKVAKTFGAHPITFISKTFDRHPEQPRFIASSATELLLSSIHWAFPDHWTSLATFHE